MLGCADWEETGVLLDGVLLEPEAFCALEEESPDETAVEEDGSAEEVSGWLVSTESVPDDNALSCNAELLDAGFAVWPEQAVNERRSSRTARDNKYFFMEYPH
jgi:hypothetical protein